MTTSAKPTQDAQGRYRYSAAIQFLEDKYGFDSYDFNRTKNHFSNWAAARGQTLGALGPATRATLFERYTHAPDGERARPESENFWHWMLDLVSPPGQATKLPSTFRLNVPKVLATYDSDVAPAREAQGAALSAMVGSVMNLIPEDMRETAQRQYAPKSHKLQPFIRTILGYFEAEFGPNMKLDMRRD
jgi:hypothetical protein